MVWSSVIAVGAVGQGRFGTYLEGRDKQNLSIDWTCVVRGREFKNDSKVFGLNNWKDGVAPN